MLAEAIPFAFGASNAWLGRNGRTIVTAAAAVIGTYLPIKGITDLAD